LGKATIGQQTVEEPIGGVLTLTNIHFRWEPGQHRPPVKVAKVSSLGNSNFGTNSNLRKKKKEKTPRTG
jgi:hypothetical protein